MSKNLVIVESPHKAKTLEKYLGADYRVLASQGHVRDIEGVGKNSLGIDFNNNYQPNYVIDPQKAHLIETLRSEAKKADTVWLASDLDREGEAIAWHLSEVLGLDEKKRRRVTFDAITEETVLQGFKNPRDIDFNLVNAQQARRVVDRIVGFELSPILWKKITTGLSAGRVQSVAVRLIVEKEREIEKFQTSYQYRVFADFTGRNPGDASVLHTELNHRFSTRIEAEEFLQHCQHAAFRVETIQRRPAHRTPAPPFTTSLLQQEAARKLKFTVSKTMRLAQSLYEAGRITYMRTDSLNLSALAVNTAKQEIIKEYGAAYSHPRHYQTSSKGAQEAHEAIRPTYMNVHVAGDNADEQRLYELIWKRTMACQMADAEVETTRMEVSISDSPYLFVATGEVLQFDGFMRAYVQSTDEEQEDAVRILPMMAEKEMLRHAEMRAQQTYSKAPIRFTEASLVKKMEELGIGRPSTYATIIETIQKRKYVERGSILGQKREYTIITMKGNKITAKQKQEVYGTDLQKLLPTDLGRMTNDFLVAQFREILSYDFTAREEETFDRIAAGETDWVSTVDSFYNMFHPMLANVKPGNTAILLGTEPGTDEPVYAKISKVGPCIQIGDGTLTKKPRFASLRKDQSIYTIKMSEAMELFRTALPYTLCEREGKEVVIGEGKYGPYLKYDGAYISLPKGTDPLTMTEEQADALIAQHSTQQSPLHDFGAIQVLRGRYGAYIKAEGGNYRIPRTYKAETLTLEDCQKIISEASSAPESTEKRKFVRKNKK